MQANTHYSPTPTHQPIRIQVETLPSPEVSAEKRSAFFSLPFHVGLLIASIIIALFG